MFYYAEVMEEMKKVPYFTRCHLAAHIVKTDGKVFRSDGNVDVLVRSVHRGENNEAIELWQKVAVKPTEIINICNIGCIVEVGDAVVGSDGKISLVVDYDDKTGEVLLRDHTARTTTAQIENLVVIARASDAKEKSKCIEGGLCPEFVERECQSCRHCCGQTVPGNAEAAYCQLHNKDISLSDEACKNFTPYTVL